jgi:hypothetical protein
MLERSWMIALTVPRPSGVRVLMIEIRRAKDRLFLQDQKTVTELRVE